MGTKLTFSTNAVAPALSRLLQAARFLIESNTKTTPSFLYLYLRETICVSNLLTVNSSSLFFALLCKTKTEPCKHFFFASW